MVLFRSKRNGPDIKGKPQNAQQFQVAAPEVALHGGCHGFIQPDDCVKIAIDPSVRQIAFDKDFIRSRLVDAAFKIEIECFVFDTKGHRCLGVFILDCHVIYSKRFGSLSKVKVNVRPLGEL